MFILNATDRVSSLSIEVKSKLPCFCDSDFDDTWTSLRSVLNDMHVLWFGYWSSSSNVWKKANRETSLTQRDVTSDLVDSFMINWWLFLHQFWWFVFVCVIIAEILLYLIVNSLSDQIQITVAKIYDWRLMISSYRVRFKNHHWQVQRHTDQIKSKTYWNSRTGWLRSWYHTLYIVRSLLVSYFVITTSIIWIAISNLYFFHDIRFMINVQYLNWISSWIHYFLCDVFH